MSEVLEDRCNMRWAAHDSTVPLPLVIPPGYAHRVLCHFQVRGSSPPPFLLRKQKKGGKIEGKRRQKMMRKDEKRKSHYIFDSLKAFYVREQFAFSCVCSNCCYEYVVRAGFRSLHTRLSEGELLSHIKRLQRVEYQFFLQVKQDILQGRLPVTPELAAELGAYVVQCESLI
ncbi:unnamed protein product [Bemisia tabaci]|uniref:FERM central domain-containing protein n=1 Tax=Bemisia tabaci TaxID=7038 RepID=A0A9N9ZZ57_BEMTA|nr:unnamed protein product [Bemisia tabaci]